MRSSLVVSSSNSAYAKVATVLGSISASTDTVESKRRQMKKGWIKKIPLEKKNSVPYLIVGSREEQHLAVLAQVLVNPEGKNGKLQWLIYKNNSIITWWLLHNIRLEKKLSTLRTLCITVYNTIALLSYFPRVYLARGLMQGCRFASL